MELIEINNAKIKEATTMSEMIVSELMLKGRESGIIPLVKNIDELKFVVTENIERSFDKKLSNVGGTK